jgi:serine/threonine protein phosphatase PrpC
MARVIAKQRQNMKFSIYQSSRQGGRKYNQDRLAYSYSKESLLMVLADGMGGHLHGEIAAQITVQMLAESFQKQARPLISDPFNFLERVMHNVHEAIGDYALEHALLETPRTTCVACVIQQGTAFWAHVGDSRLYLFRGEKLLARTRDHSKVQQLFEQGQISEAQMTTHPERNKIYSCLGGIIPPEVEISPRVKLEKGDTLMMCSDGLWGQLSINEVASILGAYPLNQALPELLDHAEFRGGQDGDNLSVVAMTWGDTQRAAVETTTTMTMPLDAFTTQLDQFDVERNVKGEPNVTDEDIERAIGEINQAIKKYIK